MSKTKKRGRPRSKDAGRNLSRHFSLAPETVEALEELREGLREALPHATQSHTLTFAVEQAIHFTVNSCRAGKVSYLKIFGESREPEEA